MLAQHGQSARCNDRSGNVAPRAQLGPLRQITQRLLGKTVRRLDQRQPLQQGAKQAQHKSPRLSRRQGAPLLKPRLARPRVPWATGWISRFHGFRGWSSGLHRPVGVILLPAATLGLTAAVAGLTGPLWLPVLTGTALGGTFAFLNRWCNVRFWLSPRAPLSVVITGGSRGLGKALARELLREGDRVLITSRTPEGLAAALRELREEVGGALASGSGAVAAAGGALLFGAVVDVSQPSSVGELPLEALRRLGGRVDVWVNNAAVSGSFQSLEDSSDEALAAVACTNLLGSLLCARAAARLLQQQPGGGHIFNMDGAGADGQATPQYAAYGATKASIAQLTGSLAEELAGTSVCVHTLSPGMIITDLLLEGATPRNKQVFNILCEHPETVAAFLVPRIKSIVARGDRGAYVRYLTPLGAIWRLATVPWRVNRFFDAEGVAVYPAEKERIMGRHVKVTERAAAGARRRNHALRLAYSCSLILSVGAMLLFGTHGVPAIAGGL